MGPPPPRAWPDTVAHGLLRGSNHNPGPIELGSDGRIDRKDAWWHTVHEDSIRLGNGQVLTLLSWKHDQQLEAGAAYQGSCQPWKPGKNARARLVKALCQNWGYRRLRYSGEDIVLLTDEPSRYKITVLHPRQLNKKTMRLLLASVAKHKGVEAEKILDTMLADPKWVRVDDPYGRP